MPPVTKSIKIFDSFPPANEETFKYGGPISAKTGESKVLIFYAPKLQTIATIDNTGSDATTTYSKSISVGFVFGMSQTVSIESTIEFDAVFAKGNFKIGMSLTFSQQWSTTTTETYSFEVPAGKKGFTYQGYIQTATLVNTHANNSYAYDGPKGNLYTPALVTRNTPIT